MYQPNRVILRGGPEGTPSTHAVDSLGDGDRVKIFHGNAYEHFEFSHRYEKFDGDWLPVYRWCYRTYVAE